MATFVIPVPDAFSQGIVINPDGGPTVASAHAERYDDITLQVALARKEAADLYADDARRAYQRRIDSVSMAESIATQQLNTSRLAQEVAQLRAGTSQPPVVVNGTAQ